MKQPTSLLLLLSLLLLAASTHPHAAHAAATPSSPAGGKFLAATAAIRGGGNGVVIAAINDLPGSAVPANMYDVLGGLPRPEAMTQVVMTSHGLQDKLQYTVTINQGAVPDDGSCTSLGPVWGQPLGDKTEWTKKPAGALTDKYGPLTRDASNLKKVRVLDPTIKYADLVAAAGQVSLVVSAVLPDNPRAEDPLVRMACGTLRAYDVQKQDQPMDSVSVVVKNTKGPGELLLLFSQQKVTEAMPASLFDVLGGAKKPESLVQVTSVARGFDPDKTYQFHIHEAAIGTPGDCASTKDHWDPLQAHPRFRGGKKEDYKPVPGNWSSYELGDLSGKYGAINGDVAPGATPKQPLPNFVSRQRMQQSDNGNTTTVEGYVVLDPTLTKVADFAKLSVVLHNAAGERVGCSNLSPREFLAGLQTASAAGEGGKAPSGPPNVMVQDAAVKEAEDKVVAAGGSSGALRAQGQAGSSAVMGGLAVVALVALVV